MEKIRKAMEEMVDLAKSKNYTREEVEIIGTIVCSTTAKICGYTPLEGLKLAKEYCEKYDNGRDCINALVEIIK